METKEKTTQTSTLTGSVFILFDKETLLSAQTSWNDRLLNSVESKPL